MRSSAAAAAAATARSASWLLRLPPRKGPGPGCADICRQPAQGARAAELISRRRPRRRCSCDCCRGTVQKRRRHSSATADTVPVVYVDASNFEEVRPEVERAIREATFVGFDCEFTGLHRERQQGMTALQSAAARYRTLRAMMLGGSPADAACGSCGAELHEAARFCPGCGARRKRRRAAASPPLFSDGDGDDGDDDGDNDQPRLVRRQGYLVAQVGLSCFAWDAEAQRHHVSVFCFYLSPRPWAVGGAAANVKVSHDLQFGCLASSLQFLSNHGFDFNRWLRSGVPYLSRRVHAAEKGRLELKGQPMLLRELDTARGFFDVWDTLLESRKPLVGHQCMLDLLYLWQQLEEPLPSDLKQFLRKISGRIGVAVDTKHMLCGQPRELAAVIEGGVAAAAAAGDKRLQQNLARVMQLVRPSMDSRVAGVGLRSLQLAELHELLSPIVADTVPVITNGARAHDAGHDAFMTGVVFAAAFRLLRGRDAVPDTATLLSDSAPQFANRLHVFAAPYALDVSSKPPPFADTHRSTVVVTSRSLHVDPARLRTLLRFHNPHGEVYWVRYQRTAVVVLESPSRAAADLKKLIDRFAEVCAKDGLTVTPAVDWLTRRRTEPSVARKQRSRRLKAARMVRQSRQRQWAARESELRSARESAAEASDLRRRAEAQALKLRQELERMRGEQEALQQRSQESIEAAAAGLDARRRMDEERLSWTAQRDALEQDKAALDKRCDEYRSSMDAFKQQAETLRDQLRGAQTNVQEVLARAERAELSSTEVARKLRAEMRTEREKWQRKVGEAQKEAKKAREAAATDGGSDEAAAEDGAAEQAALKDGVGGPEGLNRIRQRRAMAPHSTGAARGPEQAAAAPAPAAGGRPGPREKPARKTTKRPRVEELRPFQWVVEWKAGKDMQAPADIVIDPVAAGRKAHVLDIRECKYARVFLRGLMGSVTLTDCEHVHVYCEEAVSDPSSRSWGGWGDSKGVSGHRIFIYGGDKASIRVVTAPLGEWPSLSSPEVYSRGGQKGRAADGGDERVRAEISETDVLRAVLITILAFVLLLKVAPQPGYAPPPRQG
eukprot:TRINITY_DN942_c3_g1_i1.p1 TRINITY_DN942_c3_g1~~TRINITY_DN942_c3_g1_i1.p1  ORF type:complete len:1080 (+),score=428.52 TRINITY_DN942_c3_g1_i1:45-3242(+)